MVSRGAMWMTPPRLVLSASLLACLACLACRSKPRASAVDASTDAPPSDAAASATPSSSASPSASAAAASASASASAAPSASVFSMFEGMPLPPPSPFSGHYRCAKPLELVQTGSIVRGTLRTSATVETIIACTAGRDTCTGTVRDIEQRGGGAPKVTHVKPVTLRLAPNGDLAIVPNAGAETRCPRL